MSQRFLFCFQGSDQSLSMKWAGTRAQRVNKSWAGTETYKRAGTETCKRRPRCESRQAEYGTVLEGARKCKAFFKCIFMDILETKNENRNLVMML